MSIQIYGPNIQEMTVLTKYQIIILGIDTLNMSNTSKLHSGSMLRNIIIEKWRF